MISLIRMVFNHFCATGRFWADCFYYVECQGPIRADLYRTFTRTTLAQEMTYLIQTLDFETAKSVKLDDRFPIIEFKDDRYPCYRGIKYIEQMESPRMIKTHLHHFLLPEQLQKGKGRIIYIARNPKDALTSYFRMMELANELAEDEKTLDLLADGFIKGTGYACPWTRHVLEYWERQNASQVLFLKYEEVVRDKLAAVRRIADFLGRKLTEDDISRIADHCSVANMRDNPAVNNSYWVEFKKMNFENGARFINEGVPGTWQKFLKPEQSSKIDEMIREVAKSGLILEHTSEPIPSSTETT
ncbi:sulfotransferase 1C2-like isoform X2 [Mercenaria mercenaria]|uniref:sulfotransferase 1C2-like isoform X2 n=1 Tax=Mercenaria mercenaria TaxID=6596 RepID=UPI00234E3812|nr:sulfotransferase 1C2-like isoform X2 [Mercenaria mercenaria]